MDNFNKTSIKEIKTLLNSCPENEQLKLIEKLSSDPRKGIQSLLKTSKNKIKAKELEDHRINALYSFDIKTKKNPNFKICGIDEAGRGPLAGPITAGAVILPDEPKILGLNDSKKLSAKKREELFEIICKQAISWSCGMVSAQEIDEINIQQANRLVVYRALNKIQSNADCIAIDALSIKTKGNKPVYNIIHGDRLSACIAAASIVAKVTRDRIMIEADKKFPGYGFADHKGYGTDCHVAAINKLGPCPIHRLSFNLVLIKEEFIEYSKLFYNSTRNIINCNNIQELQKISQKLKRYFTYYSSPEISTLQTIFEKQVNKILEREC